MNSHYRQPKSFQGEQGESAITPQAIYQTLIRQTPNLYPLCKLKTNKKASKQLFPDTAKYPDFFNYNLVSPGRVIKKLEGAQSVIRGFYYQLMKLAFEIEVEQKDYIQVMKNVIFSPQFMLQESPSSPSSGKNYGDLQYKKIVAQFMQILMNQSIPNFQLTILGYPIVDEAMTKILQNLLKFKCSLDLPQSPNSQIIQQLCQIFQVNIYSQSFQVTVVQYGNCFKFQQSDIFLYQHSQSELYIAYLNQMAQMSDASESSRKKQSDHELNSSKMINKDNENDLDQTEIIRQKGRNTHQYMDNQFQIQTPSKLPQTQRHSSSNFTQGKNNSQPKTDKNHRNTFGFHQVKTQQDNLDNYSQKAKQHKNKPVPRQSRQSLINELHNLNHQFTHNQFNSINNNLLGNKDISTTNNKLETFRVNPLPIISQTQPLTRQLIHDYNPTMPNDYRQPAVYNYTQPAIHNYTQPQTAPQIPKYEYQNKAYNKRVTFQQPNKFMIRSAQSEEVIGYPEFSSGKLIHDIDAKDKQHKNQKYQDFKGFNSQIPYINTSTNSHYVNGIKMQETEDIFYSPKTLLNKTNIIQPSNKLSYQKNQQTLGTLYKQFSDTKVLDILPEEVQYNIRKMRRKYKGIHAKDFFGFK